MELELMIALAVASTIGGFLMRWNVPWQVRAAIVVPLVGTYAVHAWEDTERLPLVVTAVLALAGIALAARVAPHALCCGGVHGEPHQRALNGLAIAALLLHGAFDAELLRLAGSGWVLALLVAHKVTDGMMLRIAVADFPSRVARVAVVTGSAVAMAAGAALPDWMTENVIHSGVVALVLGFYLRTAWMMIRPAPIART